ncbi:polysaccharide pyruvyl transferase family protein [Flavobacterium sp. LT1R49]|uniref:polysaccharide pyruvyl transferase family protein n=1 Tax=Flavobacterium arabinosi TaxID=3398737 RepID=UPI003A8829A9
MKKIGILTLPLHTNYGGILQAYALQKVLENMGHEVTIISGKVKKIKLPLLKLPFVLFKRIVLRYVFGRELELLVEKRINTEQPIVCKHTHQFVDKYLNISDISFDKLPKNSFDALIVGSDQIWRPDYCENIYDSFFDFAVKWNIKRIAYAPSFGKDTWDYTELQTKRCGNLVQLFDAVSVRELGGVRLCKKNFKIDAEVVLDPTMLLFASDYIDSLQIGNTPKSSGNLMVYVLDNNASKNDIIGIVKDKLSLTIFKTGSKVEDIFATLDQRIQPHIEEWLRGFYDADFVVTDSFHACVFSILFNKPFVVCSNQLRGNERFVSLLSLLNLEDRIVNSTEDLDKIKLIEIDWISVNDKLDFLKKKSIDFIHKALLGQL